MPETPAHLSSVFGVLCAHVSSDSGSTNLCPLHHAIPKPGAPCTPPALAAYLLQRTELIETVERLQVVAKNGDNVIKFDLVPQNQSLLVSAFAAGFGQGKELLACVQVAAIGCRAWR